MTPRPPPWFTVTVVLEVEKGRGNLNNSFLSAGCQLSPGGGEGHISQYGPRASVGAGVLPPDQPRGHPLLQPQDPRPPGLQQAAGGPGETGHGGDGSSRSGES